MKTNYEKLEANKLRILIWSEYYNCRRLIHYISWQLSFSVYQEEINSEQIEYMIKADLISKLKELKHFRVKLWSMIRNNGLTKNYLLYVESFEQWFFTRYPQLTKPCSAKHLLKVIR